MASELSRITDFLTKMASMRLVGNRWSRTLWIASAEIETVTLSLSSLHSWRNSLLHVSRLPPEPLTAIFLEYALECDDTFAGVVPDWVTVSHICRTWRQVALNCPALWTRLFFVSRPLMDELLARSKTSTVRSC